MVKTPPPNLSPLQEIKSVLSRTVVAVAVIAGVAVMFSVVMIGLVLYGLTSLSSSCKINEKKLQESVAAQKASLDSLTILSGQQANSKSYSNNECPDGEVLTSVELPTSLSASQAATEVKQNLEKQGFKEEYPLDIPHTNGSPKDNDTLGNLEESYLKNDKTVELIVSYNFAKEYSCGDVQRPCDKQVAFFLETPLKSISLNYTQSTN